MSTTVQVCIGNDTPQQIERTTGTVTYVLHLWIPSGRLAVGVDNINQADALSVWQIVATALSPLFDIVPLATCSGADEATDPAKWKNVFNSEIAFPARSQKPYHVRFTATPLPGITLPRHVEIPAGSPQNVDLNALLTECGVTFNVDI